MTTNDGYTYRETVEPAGDGETVLDYLARRYRHSTRDAWRARIHAGQVRVDERTVAPDAVVRRGQRLAWCRPPWREPDVPTLDYAVLHEDDDVLAVAKPAGLPTVPGAGYLHHTLLARVRSRAPRAVPLHRLGRWTSGVVLFALNVEARASLARQWARRSVEKVYRTLVSGAVERPLEVTAPIGPVRHHRLGSVFAVSPDGREARTSIAPVEVRHAATLCDVRIESGRPHQIRIHLAAAGHPLVGDPLYPEGGVPAPDVDAVPGDPGYALHATELGVAHPRTGGPLRVRCAPPPVLRRSS